MDQKDSGALGKGHGKTIKFSGRVEQSRDLLLNQGILRYSLKPFKRLLFLILETNF